MKTGCGCSTSSPYDNVEAVWHDPTKYDVAKHGPSYLGLSKLAKAQKEQVRAFVKQAADYDTRGVSAVSESPLSIILVFMRGLVHVHQSHHWQTQGESFFADHLLFERLYDESLEFIDQVAERAIGIYGPGSVDPLQQAEGMLQVVSKICGHLHGSVTPELMVARSLRAEVAFLKALEISMGDMEASGKMTSGTSNLLEGVADLHETFVYLLRQRSGEQMYSYGR